MCTISGLKNGPVAPIIVDVISKQELLYLDLVIQKLYSLKGS